MKIKKKSQFYNDWSETVNTWRILWKLFLRPKCLLRSIKIKSIFNIMKQRKYTKISLSFGFITISSDLLHQMNCNFLQKITLKGKYLLSMVFEKI